MSVAACAPVDMGAKAMESVQDAPGARDATQLLDVMRKLVSPETICDVSASAAVPGLVICTICGGLTLPMPVLPNARGDGVMETLAVPWPVPESSVVPARFKPVEASVSEPKRVPSAVGAKTTVSVHVPPLLTPVVPLQVLLMGAKSPSIWAV